LSAVLDIEGKIPRALDALGPMAGSDVLLVDADQGARARQLAELGARLTLLERDAARADALRRAIDGSPAVTVRKGEPIATGLPDRSVDRVVSLWSAFRDRLETEAAEALRVLRPGGRLLVLHDYGRDDVSRLRDANLPEYGAWSRRDGWFLRSGFKVRVVHCWWTFDSVETASEFLVDAFAERGREVAATMRRPRLSYNVAIYHLARSENEAQAELVGAARSR
jgi:SAM-dependent methyltransferase